jgi:hypothetical protein
MHKYISGEAELSIAGVTMICWDDDLIEGIREHDPAKSERIDLQFYDTSAAALWGCNAITIKAAAQLTADSECFQYFSVHHREGVLNAIACAVRGAEPQQEQGNDQY